MHGASQGHYLTVLNDGVLVGAGGHIHNGGLYTDLYDDSGRLLCRNELVLGEVPHEHPDDDPPMTTTTMHDHGPTTTTTTTMHDHGPTTTMTMTTTMHDHGQDAVAAPTTTEVADEVIVGMGPPEMYPDDPPLEAITACRTHEQLTAGQVLYFEATYANERPRSGVMGIYMLYVWEGGGPETPAVVGPPPVGPPTRPWTPGVTVPVSSSSTTGPPGSSVPDQTDPPDGSTGSDDVDRPDDVDDPGDPDDPGESDGPAGTIPTTPGASDPSDELGSGSTQDPGGIAGESGARPAPAARPYRGTASYTG
ncbi:MAG: hypothetical protein GX643_14370 [Acidimicrobiales bacterium]|nr:hypothetical protein [Acidimicrobiales bacterium]